MLENVRRIHNSTGPHHGSIPQTFCRGNKSLKHHVVVVSICHSKAENARFGTVDIQTFGLRTVFWQKGRKRNKKLCVTS